MARPEERASNLVSLRRDTRSYWWPSSEPVRPEVRPASTAARRGVRRCVRTAVGPTRPERQPLCGVWPADDSRQFDGGRRSVQRIEWSGALRSKHTLNRKCDEQRARFEGHRAVVFLYSVTKAVRFRVDCG